ncbi:MAG: hypothetical protein GX933_10305 [Chloroflexi bacterium]|nr:hypothetical protein [Chloroflexota bacterium]
MNIKRSFLLTMVIFLLFFFVSVAFAEGVTVIGESNKTSDSLQVGETVSVEKVCDFTPLSYVTGSFAVSISAYEKSDDHALFPTEASSSEYKLLDVRVNILNKMRSDMEIDKVFSAKAIFMDEYEFPLTYIKTELINSDGTVDNSLYPAKPIPMLVQRTVHFIFEVPNIVAESSESLVVTFGVENDEYEFILR